MAKEWPNRLILCRSAQGLLGSNGQRSFRLWSYPPADGITQIWTHLIGIVASTAPIFFMLYYIE